MIYRPLRSQSCGRGRGEREEGEKRREEKRREGDRSRGEKSDIFIILFIILPDRILLDSWRQLLASLEKNQSIYDINIF